MAFFGLGGGCCMQIAHDKTKVYIKPSLGGHRGCYRACYMSHISLLLSIQLTYKLQKKQFPPLLLPFHYYYDNDGEMYIEQLKKEIPTVKHLF